MRESPADELQRFRPEIWAARLRFAHHGPTDGGVVPPGRGSALPGHTCPRRGRVWQDKRAGHGQGRPSAAGTQPGRPVHSLARAVPRATGATWRNANGRTDFPAASTIKLAMVADVMLRADRGQIVLGPDDWSLIYNILHESSDVAGDQLWFSFEDASFLGRIQRFGMRTASFSQSPAYWGYMYCSPQDLDNLMNYILGKLPARNRDYIVDHLRHVAQIQQWGVWGAHGTRWRSCTP